MRKAALIFLIQLAAATWTGAGTMGFAVNLAGIDQWQNITPPGVSLANNGIVEVLADPLHPGAVYTAIYAGGIFRSTDYGDTWVKIDTGRNADVMGSGGQWSMQMDPTNPLVLYSNNLYGSNAGLFKTTNGGVDWDPLWSAQSEIAQIVPYSFCQEVTIDPTNHLHVAVTFHENCSGDYAPMCMADSKDGGATWRLFHGPTSGWVENARPLLINGARILYVTGGDVYYSSDTGSTWNRVAAGGGHQLYWAANGYVYMGGGSGVIRSSDNGATWAKAGSTAPNGDAMIGDGVRLFTSWPGCCGDTNSFYSATEANGTDWKAYPGPNLNGARAVYFAYDTSMHVMYAAATTAGLWRVVTMATQPDVVLSDTMVSVSFFRGQSWTPQSVNVTAVNRFKQNFHLAGPLTVSNRRSWLTVTVNAANVDSQVITNTIDPSSFANADAHVLDTVTVHAAGTRVVDQTYLVSVWVRQQAVLTTFAVVPADSGTVPSCQPYQFAVTANDQYGQPMPASMPIAWSAAGGVVSQTGLFTPSGPGAGNVVVSTQGAFNASDTTTLSIVNCSRGIAYDYYASAVSSVNDIASLTATSSGVVAAPSANPTTTAGVNFALRFRGYILVPAKGSYTFYTYSDDGSALYIDGNQVVNNDGGHSPQEKSGAVSLGWGLHAVQVLFFQQGGGDTLTVSWQGPGVAKAVIPDSMLFNATGPVSQRSMRQIARSAGSRVSVGIFGRDLAVMAPVGIRWQLDLFSLSGERILHQAGSGAAVLKAIDSGVLLGKNFVVTKITTASGESFKALLCPLAKLPGA